MADTIEELIGKLNPREIESLHLLAAGMNTSEISKYLSMSYHEAAEINQTIKRKLNISSVNDIAKLLNNINS